MNTEHDYITYLKTTDLVHLVADAVVGFETVHGEKPTVIFLNKRLQVPFTRALVLRLNIPAETAVYYPFFLDGIPVTIAPLIDDSVVLISATKQVKEVI